MRKISDTTTVADGFEEHESAKLPSTLLATDMKVTGQPLDPAHVGRIIKPRELVDIIELTPLTEARRFSITSSSRTPGTISARTLSIRF